ncbi:hypothetical protein D3C86_1202830 [compost metagenome]
MDKPWYLPFGTERIKSAKIQIQNPGTSAASGKVTVTFSWKGEQAETKDLSFNVAAGQSTTLDVTPSKKANEISVSTSTDAGYGTGTGTGYNNGAGTGYNGY